MTDPEKQPRGRVLALCCIRSLAVAPVAVLVMMLGACGDEAVDQTANPPPEVIAAPWQLHAIAWLKQTDSVAPEQWLASREAGRDLGPYDPAVDEMRRGLVIATMRFRDHPRMIANRAVQLEGMLREKGIPERAPALIAVLSEVPGDVRYVESFASLTQQYYNLRMEGLGRAQAVDVLRQQTGE
jgi:hypothetical protein